MSTGQRKHRGGAVNSKQASKRSRLLAPSAGGTSEAEPIDFEETGTLFFELAGKEFIDLANESSESEDINLTADYSVVQWEQDQQHPLVSRAADNSVVLLTTDDEEETRLNDDSAVFSTWAADTVSSPFWMDEYSEWEQNLQYPFASRAADNSVVLLANDNEEKLGDNDGPSGTITSMLYQDCFLWQWEQDQQHPLVSRAADNSVVLLTTDDEEETRLNDDSAVFSTWAADTVSSPFWMDEYSELLEGYEQQRRNLTSRGQQLSDSSVLNSTDGDETSTSDNDFDTASEEGGSLEEKNASSKPWPAGTVRCPICMDFYSEIVQSERRILSTPCGHVFCSQCLPVALGTASTCPTCRTELTHKEYHPIYI